MNLSISFALRQSLFNMVGMVVITGRAFNLLPAAKHGFEITSVDLIMTVARMPIVVQVIHIDIILHILAVVRTRGADPAVDD